MAASSVSCSLCLRSSFRQGTADDQHPEGLGQRPIRRALLFTKRAAGPITGESRGAGKASGHTAASAINYSVDLAGSRAFGSGLPIYPAVTTSRFALTPCLYVASPIRGSDA